MTDAPISVAVDATALRREVSAVAGLARGMGSALTDAFRGAVVEGESLGGVLRDLGLRLSELSLTAALKPVEGFLGNVLTKGFVGQGSIAAPHYLPRSSSSPDAGPMTAAGSSGRAEFSASPSMRGATQVTVNIATPDASSFRRSENQVSAALARAVARGHRSL